MINKHSPDFWTIYIDKINYILFPFCPGDSAIIATILLADICMFLLTTSMFP